MTQQDAKGATARGLGLCFIAAALALNSTSLAHFFAADETIQASRTLRFIWAFQAVLAVLGVVLLLGWRGFPRSNALRGLAALALIGATAAGIYGWAKAERLDVVLTDVEKRTEYELSKMIASESVHLKLTPVFAKLNDGAKNLRVPSGGSESVFTDRVTIADLTSERPHLYKELDEVGTSIETFAVEASERTVARNELDLLRPLLDQVEYFDHAKFGFVGGDFTDDTYRSWEVKGFFQGLAKLKDGSAAQIKGNLVCRWDIDAEADPKQNDDLNNRDLWKIGKLVIKDMKLVRSPRGKFFSEELDRAVPDPASYKEARRNINREYLNQMLLADFRKEKWTPPHEYFDFKSAYVMPTVSVVDLDRDGHDDFYKMAQYGKNQFFHNNANGTFTDEAAQRGLDIADYCNVGLFADFDNDEDADLFLGRSLVRSQYLTQQGGEFSDRTEELFDHPMPPYWASTASAVDYDRDGMLDLYIGTYAAQATIRDLRASRLEMHQGKVLPEYLPEDQSVKLGELGRKAMEHYLRDRVGPPNVLMHNEGGGKLAWVKDTPLTLYRNTFQATWADYDDDGDPDVYAANDFSLNNLFRNEGNGTFADVTDATKTGDVGFGMGCSWGDVDNDGTQELYVSNMFSKAGNRILPRITTLDRRFIDMAAGNSLFAFNGASFDKISGKDDSKKMVEIAGWSWGSQFADVNNDGWLDIYVLNGYYSAPEFFKSDVDL